MLSLLKNLQVEPLPLVQAAPERCLRRRLSTCDCRLCLDGCSAGALSFDGRQLRLDPDRCTGCLVCVAACPNEALVSSWDLEGMLRAVREEAGKRLVVSCIRQKRRSAEELAVPCLGLFGKEALVALGRSGCRSIEFDLAGCPACENRQAAERFQAAYRRVAEGAAGLLSTDLVISDTSRQEPPQEEGDRRSFLAGMRAKLSTLSRLSPAGPESFNASRPAKTGGRRLPLRVRIVERVIEAAAGEQKERLQALCTHEVTAGPACTRCPLCTGICPTGALRVAGIGTEKRLLFNAARCSGCGLCVSFCRKSAIFLSLSPLSDCRPAWP